MPRTGSRQCNHSTDSGRNGLAKCLSLVLIYQLKTEFVILGLFIYTSMIHLVQVTQSRSVG